jgi:nucleotide-binding universal stress UspA family protein
VVVGIDGSVSSVEALCWAVANLPADADVHAVWALPYWGDGLIAMDTELYEHAREAAGAELADAITTALQGAAGNVAAVTAHVEGGAPREVLTDESAGMDLVVVGDRGRTGVAARVLGSVADHVLRNAPCPVIVVPIVEHTPATPS